MSSVTRDLELVSYHIEQLWIEGRNPVQIADELDCHVQLVEDWIVDQGLSLDEDLLLDSD